MKLTVAADKMRLIKAKAVKTKAVKTKPFGLVLSGGLSTRMGSDKGSLIYEPSRLTQRMRSFELLSGFCEKVFISCRKEQQSSIEVSLPAILDSAEGQGPGVGLLSAFKMFPDCAWLIFACDFPFATEEDVAHLVLSRSREHAATCYLHSDGTIEPLFSIWEREALETLNSRFQDFGQSPSRVLRSLHYKEVVPLHPRSLLNINRQSEHLQSD